MSQTTNTPEDIDNTVTDCTPQDIIDSAVADCTPQDIENTVTSDVTSQQGMQI